MKRVLLLCSSVIVLFALAGCGGLAAQATPTATLPPTDTPTPSPTPIPRSATIKTVEGTVELRVGAQGTFAPAAAGETMAAGDELKTGKDGRALVVLDDGTGMVIAADSSLDLTALEGSHESPVSQFFLNIGSVFTIGHGELAPNASYEIDTPKGVATIRGSMLGVTYSLDKGTEVTCMIGHCGASLNGKEVELTGGKKVTITDQGVSDATDMDAKQKLEWSKAIKTGEDAGIKTSESISTTCSCSGKDMKCSDGVTIASFPTCVQGPGCACSADGGLSCGSQTTAKSPVCTAGATNCTCSGPNLICDGGKTFYNVAACTGGATCLCSGPDLTCSDGTTYPADPSCAPRTGCTCTQGFLTCPDGSMSFNTPSCANSDIPCSCDGTTFVCNVDGTTSTIPNYPLCGGSAGTGGTPICVCSGGVMVCSDNTTAGSCDGGPSVPNIPNVPSVPDLPTIPELPQQP